MLIKKNQNNILLDRLNNHNYKVELSFHAVRCDLAKNLSNKLIHNKDSMQNRMLGLFIKRILSHKKTYAKHCLSRGIGQVVHFSSGNEPLNCLYSWFISFIMGNINIVRVSDRADSDDLRLITDISKILDEYNILDAFVHGIDKSFFSDAASKVARVRLIWGSDNTIASIKSYKTPINCTDYIFGDRLSGCILDLSNLQKRDLTSSNQLVSGLCNDLIANEGALCSSPSVIYLISNGLDTSIDMLHTLLDHVIALSDLKSPWNLALFNKKTIYNQQKMCSTEHPIQISNFNGYTLQYTSSFSETKNLFRTFEVVTASCLKEISFLPSNMQTLTYYGIRPVDMSPYIIQNVLRLVPVGMAHQFDYLWDGIDLFTSLSLKTYLK